MAKNLFKTAKKVDSKTAKKDEKIRVNLNDPDFFEKIKSLEEINDRMKSDKAQADMISDEIRDISKDEFIKMYESTGGNPGSVYIESIDVDTNQTASVFFVPSDKYISIDENKAERLTEKYGDGVVEENTEFVLDMAMVEKYGDVLSRIILESLEIDENDKEKIIKAKTKYSIAKGMIDKMNTFVDHSVEEVMEEIKPIFSLKNIQVVKG